MLITRVCLVELNAVFNSFSIIKVFHSLIVDSFFHKFQKVKRPMRTTYLQATNGKTAHTKYMIMNLYVEIVQKEKTNTKNVTIYESKMKNGRYKLISKKVEIFYNKLIKHVIYSLIVCFHKFQMVKRTMRTTYLQTKITKQRIQSI